MAARQRQASKAEIAFHRVAGRHEGFPRTTLRPEPELAPASGVVQTGSRLVRKTG